MREEKRELEKLRDQPGTLPRCEAKKLEARVKKKKPSPGGGQVVGKRTAQRKGDGENLRRERW